MGIKFRLTAMQFLQFFIWGAWLISLGSYMNNTLHFEGGQIGAIFATMGIAALFMPGLTGIIADKWINAERLYGLLHLIGAGALFYASTATTYQEMYWAMLLNMLAYMPTLSLANTVSYNALEKYHLDLIKDFPPIRVWGTVGFICAMWLVDLLGFQANYMQFFTCAVWGVILAVYANTLPQCPVTRNTGGQRKSLVEALGLKAFLLFRQRKMAIFFIFSMLLGVSLQITNGFANPFITSFSAIPEYADTFGVQHANLLISLSQISETCCILLIPFFLGRFGIKKVMLIAMIAWVLRFGLFGLGNPGSGVWMFILSMIVYGVAFDFFNVSGSLFVDKETDISVRSSAQGLFIIMTNGLGATIGTLTAQWVVNQFVDFSSTEPQVEGWTNAWFIFAAYALIVAVMFSIVFKYKHEVKTV